MYIIDLDKPSHMFLEDFFNSKLKIEPIFYLIYEVTDTPPGLGIFQNEYNRFLQHIGVFLYRYSYKLFESSY